MDNGQWTVDYGQWTWKANSLVAGGRTVDCRLWTVKMFLGKVFFSLQGTRGNWGREGRIVIIMAMQIEALEWRAQL